MDWLEVYKGLRKLMENLTSKFSEKIVSREDLGFRTAGKNKLSILDATYHYPNLASVMFPVLLSFEFPGIRIKLA